MVLSDNFKLFAADVARFNAERYCYKLSEAWDSNTELINSERYQSGRNDMKRSPCSTMILGALSLAALTLTMISDVHGENFKKPSRQLVDRYDACLVDNIFELDDNVSEARTIADAVNTTCRDDLKAMIASSIPSTDVELVAARKMHILVPHYEEQVLPMVLKRRSSTKKRQSEYLGSKLAELN